MFPRKNAVAPARTPLFSFDDNSFTNGSYLSDIDDDQDSAIRSNRRLVSSHRNPTKLSSQPLRSSKQPNVPIHSAWANEARSAQKRHSTVSTDDDGDDEQTRLPPRVRQEEKV